MIFEIGNNIGKIIGKSNNTNNIGQIPIIAIIPIILVK